MPSVTTWTRLEPHCRSSDMNESLRARVSDPLWLLARQWQFGEFQGSDSGSPIIARYRGETSRLNRYINEQQIAAGELQAEEFNSDKVPLEVVVERERVRNEKGAWLRLAAEAGLHFLRLLANKTVSEATRGAYLQTYPLMLTAEQLDALDDNSLRFLKVMQGRVLDGSKLYAAIRQAPDAPESWKWGLPPEYEIEATDIPKVAGARETWLAWYKSLFSEPLNDTSSWNAERIEYAFAASTQTSAGEVVLRAREYRGGQLDWHSFDIDRSVSLQAVPDVDPIVAASVPAPVSFRGMPSARYWEFEDAQVNFGAIEAEPEDLARLFLMEFALIYSNDWFVIPVELAVGSICRPRSLIVIDTFGNRSLVRSYTEVDGAHASWRMFQIAPEFFFIPPVITASLQSQPIEEVIFHRDEMANMVWAVERIVESPSGQRLKRFEEFQQKYSQGEHNPTEGNQQPASADRPLVYSLASEMPRYWIPFLPSRIEGQSIRLRWGSLLQSDGTSTAAGAKGQILGPHTVLNVYEEEVPRSGARIIRTYQYARWIDGSTHLWVGRQKQPGRGEGSSGLGFDTVE